jgi:transcriptional regulator with XRE-family HTH domain
LGKRSGVSASTVSRLRKGTRFTKSDSEIPEKLGVAIRLMAEEKGVVLKEKPEQAFIESLKVEEEKSYKYTKEFSEKIDFIMEALSIPNVKLARYMAMDASYISRIRKGERAPGNIEDFVRNLCGYLSRNHQNEKDIGILLEVTGISEIPETYEAFCPLFLEWVSKGKISKEPMVKQFLDEIDAFNLEEYLDKNKLPVIRTINIPMSPFVEKKYYGLDAMQKGLRDFIKTAVFSKNTGDLFLYSDMKLDIIGKNEESLRKMMMGFLMLMKKGLTINMIHFLDRSVKEMVMGLSMWIPLYMTGQINPYYFKVKSNNVFGHTLFLSKNTVALSGECVEGKEDKGMCLLTKKNTEVAYYSEKAEDILAKASPLMEIYRKENKEEYLVKARKIMQKKGDWINYHSPLPVYTLPETLLKEILKKQNVAPDEIKEITHNLDLLKNYVKEHLKTNQIIDYVRTYEDDMHLSLSLLMSEENLIYNEEVYKRHLEATKAFAKKNTNYHFEKQKHIPFKNIAVFICKGSVVMVSKNSSPMIQFIIEHRKLCEAFEKMT